MILLRCIKCNKENNQSALFCIECGASLKGLKGLFSGVKKRIQHQTKDWVSNARVSIDNQIAGYIKQIDDQKELIIRGRKIPDDKKDMIRRALSSFKERVGEKEELSQEFKDWMENLPNMMDDQKCIVCFSNWKAEDDIVVCKNCHSGGHRSHLFDWVKTNKKCPFCRSWLKESGLIQVTLR